MFAFLDRLADACGGEAIASLLRSSNAERQHGGPAQNVPEARALCIHPSAQRSRLQYANGLPSGYESKGVQTFMVNRRQLSRRFPQPVRQRLYDWSRSRRRRWREVPGVTNVEAPAKAALSFDDGPDDRCTPKVLDALADVGATATFFVVGEQAVKHPNLVQDIYARGHELGVHGMTHRRHDGLSEEEARTELLQGIEAIQDACGQRPQRYRPPFGAASPRLASVSNELGLQLTYWSAWGQDWDNISASRIARLVIRDLDAGSVILLHDSALYGQRDDATPTVESIPMIASAAHDRGLDLVSLASVPAAATGAQEPTA